MRVATNSLPNDLIAQLQRQQVNQLDLQKQLISQQRIHKGSDDPLAFRGIKETESQQRAMRAYRANWDRATLVADLTTSSLDNLKGIVRDALQSADMIETSINDRVIMQTSANLVNDLMEQVLEVLNSKNGDQHLFSGASITTTPFEVVRDSFGDISKTATIGQSGSDVTEATAHTLEFGQTYAILTPGANSNFTTSGATANTAGTQFTYNGTPPATWDGASLQVVPTLASGKTYRIENATGVDFTTAGAAANTVGSTFVYNGNPISWVTGGAAALTQVAANLTETDESKLVVGKAYEIAGTLGATSNFTDSGSSANTVGTQFVYNGFPPNWNGAELIPLEAADTALVYDPYELSTGKLYKIADAATLGEPISNVTESDLTLAPNIPAGYTVPKDLTVIANVAGDYSSLGGPAAATVGNVFTVSTAGAVPTGLELLEAPLQSGKTYRIERLGTSTDLTGIDNTPTVGEIFVSNGTQPTTWDGAQFKSLTLPTYNDAFTAGESVAIGKTVQVSATADYSALTAGVDYLPATATALTKGQVITALTAFTVPTGGEMRELVPNLNGQTALDAGESYVIGTTTAATTKSLSANEIILDSSTLVTGESYTITHNGSSADFSNVGGARWPESGTTFTATGTNPVHFGGAILVEVDASGNAVTGAPITQGPLTVGSRYEVSDNGSKLDFTNSGTTSNTVGTTFTFNGAYGAIQSNAYVEDTANLGFPIHDAAEMVVGNTYRISSNNRDADFTASGAANNNAGTEFVYNGTPPALGGTLQHNIPATDFTSVGAPSNDIGTTFTSTGGTPAFGSGGVVYQYMEERTVASDFTSAGAANNNVGTVFTYNGIEPEFGSDYRSTGALVSYTRETLAASYVGSDVNFQYKVGDDKTLSAFNSGAHNAEMEAFMNSMVDLRDAYQLAADSEDDDLLTRNVALERAKDSANSLANSEENLLRAIADMGVTQMVMSLTEAKDDRLYNYHEDNKARDLNINESEVITELTQSLDVYQATLQSSARSMQSSLMDFL